LLNLVIVRRPTVPVTISPKAPIANQSVMVGAPVLANEFGAVAVSASTATAGVAESELVDEGALVVVDEAGGTSLVVEVDVDPLADDLAVVVVVVVEMSELLTVNGVEKTLGCVKSSWF
jgi:hypothetical protein